MAAAALASQKLAAGARCSGATTAAAVTLILQNFDSFQK